MARDSRACPLCGTILSSSKFASVMDAHRGIQTQLTKLRAAEARAHDELRKVRARAAVTAKRAKDSASKRLDDERRLAASRLRKHQVATLKLRERIGDLERRLKSGETAQSEGLLEERSYSRSFKSSFQLTALSILERLVTFFTMCADPAVWWSDGCSTRSSGSRRGLRRT